MEQISSAPLITIRDRTQIYNARTRQKGESNIEEYLAIMRSLEKTNLQMLSPAFR